MIEIFPKKYPLDEWVKEQATYYGDARFCITSLSWERVFLRFTVETDYAGEPEFVLASRSTHEIVPLRDKIESVATAAEGVRAYSFCVNMTAAKGRQFLDNGRWIIAHQISESEGLPSQLADSPDAFYHYQACFVAPEVAYNFEAMTRVFRYGSANKFAYTVNFTATSRDDRHLALQMNSYFMEKNRKWYKRRHIHEANSLLGKVKKAWYAFAVHSMNLYYKVLSAFRKKDGRHVLIMAETYETLGGNLKAIDDRLRERGLDKELNIDYSLRRAVGARQSVFSWVKVISKIARQDVIVIDNYVPVFSFLKLRPDVELIQVWHAGGGFKAVGYCRFGKSGSPFPAGSCHKAYTTALCGSPGLVPVFEEVFGIEAEAIRPLGMPRLDGYLDEERIRFFKENFYADYSQLRDKKIILFAPTYRGVGQKTANYSQDNVDLERVYDACGDEYVFLIKLHPFILDRFEIPARLSDRIYDFSEFPSINDLFYVTDLLITDYSSNFYEFSLMKRPMLFYTFDRQVYELTRGVYRGVKESAPGKVCDSFDELIEAIENRDFEYEKVEAFVEENFGGMEDGACDRLIDGVILKGRRDG